MSNNEAKFRLNAYRPGGHDAGDPAMADALAQAKADPALGAWFAREQAHGTAVAAKLRDIAPPAGLRDAILAGARMSGGAATTTSRRWWARPATWGALAASVVVLVGVGAVLQRNARAAADTDLLATLTVNDMLHARHGGHGAPAGELQHWLSSPNVQLASAAMPLNYDELKRTGCRTLSLGGHEVLEVCFMRAGGGPEFHLYVMRDTDLPELRARSKPAVVAKAGGAVAVWSDERYHYAVATDGPPDALNRLL